MSTSSALVYLNGQFCPANEAKVSVFDRGFTFGDGVYEVIPVYQGKPRFLNRHLARLYDSLKASRIPVPDVNWLNIFQHLIDHNGNGPMQIYLQITRGNQGVRKHDIPNPPPAPTVVAFTLHNPYPNFDTPPKGLSAVLVEDIRWLRCNIKATSMLGNVLLNDDAILAGTTTAILHRDGFVTEGSASNVFVVTQEGTLVTPPKDHLCLPGITRDIVIELINTLQLPFREEKLPVHTLINAKEIFITSTTKELYPITSLHLDTIKSFDAGPVWRTLYQAYQQCIASGYE